jgi:hypothetical protein
MYHPQIVPIRPRRSPAEKAAAEAALRNWSELVVCLVQELGCDPAALEWPDWFDGRTTEFLAMIWPERGPAPYLAVFARQGRWRRVQ